MRGALISIILAVQVFGASHFDVGPYRIYTIGLKNCYHFAYPEMNGEKPDEVFYKIVSFLADKHGEPSEFSYYWASPENSAWVEGDHMRGLYSGKLVYRAKFRTSEGTTISFSTNSTGMVLSERMTEDD